MFEFITLSFFDARYIWLMLPPLPVACSDSPAQDYAVNFYNIKNNS